MATSAPIRFVVIGCPGHGKSTVLNEFAQEDIFAVASSGQSCTQAGGDWEEKNTKVIRVDDGQTTHTLILMDTPGFPDPNPENAAKYYDYVVAKCNEQISGVLFIMKPEREQLDILQKYSILLREFVNLNVPLIILANGTESGRRKRESEVVFNERRAQGLTDFRAIARTIERAAQLHAREILVSYCVDDLEALGKDVALTFSASPPQRSSLRDMADMEKLMKAAENVEAASKQKAAYEERRIVKCKEDIESLLAEIKSLKNWAAGTCWIPFVGTVAVPILLVKAASKTERVKELYSEIGDAEGAKRAAGNLEQMKKETTRLQKAFGELKRYLRPS